MNPTMPTRTFEEYVLHILGPETFNSGGTGELVVVFAEQVTRAVCARAGCDLDGGPRCVRCLAEPKVVGA